jgi:hypothetical protein
VAENVREGDSPSKTELGKASEAPTPTSHDDQGQQVDEHAAMRETVAREYADALGKRYEPPSEETAAPEKPSFEKAEIDKRKITEYVLNADHPQGRHTSAAITSATGLTGRDADRIEAQIRDGAAKGAPVAGQSDHYGQRWSVDVPVTGPAGTMLVRTSWIVEPGSDRPRLAALAPTGT